MPQVLFEGLRILLNQKGRYDHYLGGEFEGPGGECPNCRRKLAVYLSLDLRDSRIRFPCKGLRRLPLVYCFNCDVSDLDFAYRLSGQDSLDVVLGLKSETGPEQREMDLIRQTRLEVDLLPAPFELERLAAKLNARKRLTEAEERSFAELTGNFAPPKLGSYPIVDCYNQVGGRAFLVQRLEDPRCEFCSKRRPPRMRFLASICNERRAGVRIVPDDAQIVFFACPECSTILVQHSAS